MNVATATRTERLEVISELFFSRYGSDVDAGRGRPAVEGKIHGRGTRILLHDKVGFGCI